MRTDHVHAALVRVFGEPFARDPVLLRRIADAIGPVYTLDEIADAAVYAEVPDSQYESMTIALEAAARA